MVTVTCVVMNISMVTVTCVVVDTRSKRGVINTIVAGMTSSMAITTYVDIETCVDTEMCVVIESYVGVMTSVVPDTSCSFDLYYEHSCGCVLV